MCRRVRPTARATGRAEPRYTQHVSEANSLELRHWPKGQLTRVSAKGNGLYV